MKNRFIIRQLSIFVLVFLINSVYAQQIEQTITYDNEERKYLLYLPANFDESAPVPLVVALHGLTNNGNILFESSQFSIIADTANFVLAFPTALTNSLGQTAWNNGLIVGSGADDTGFLREMIGTISSEYNIDSDRVYMTGFSMGGFMSNRMACEFSEEIAAIASHSGTIADAIHTDCVPTRPFPMMHIHGTSDLIVGYDGNWLGGFESVDTLMRYWRDFVNCSNAYTVVELDDIANDNITVEKRIYNNCVNNIELWLYTAANHGHAWLQPENDIFASKEIWDFFSRYRLNDPLANYELRVEPAFTINPNPVSDYINIHNFKSPIQSVAIYNAYGQQIQSISGDNNTVYAGDLTAGIYFVQINDEIPIKVVVARDN